MSRIPLLDDRSGLNEQQMAVWDSIVATRGSMIRPYEVLLHTPGIAGTAADLGHQIRHKGSLDDPVRELAIITTATIRDCQFEWDSHVGIARRVGVSDAAISALQGDGGNVPDSEAQIIGFVTELCEIGTVSDATFAAAEHVLGPEGIVELAALVGYYTLLAYVMNVGGAC